MTKKPWEFGPLEVTENGRYLKNGDKPFFWLADTAWLLFGKLGYDETYVYLKNRADKGYTVIQAVLFHPLLCKIGEVPSSEKFNGSVENPKYWEHCDKAVKMAEELGLYMALLPSWGSAVKKGFLNEQNAETYAEYIGNRYKNYPNVIWLFGGDIRGTVSPKVFKIEGRTLKKINPDKLIGFHPFGRTSSGMWFHQEDWLDFNMFQSGHRRYDQASLGAWDDNAEKESFFGEDNWRYVERDYERLPVKPTVDGEPSYEQILQGLHDLNQPYWQACDVRRYAYWSVFAGAMGHTYGSNAVMQFHDDKNALGSYGARETWDEAIHHVGSGQMTYLKQLMESVSYQSGMAAEELLLSPQGEKHERISVFAGDGFVFVYDYSGRPFEIDISGLAGKKLSAYWLEPSSGIYSFIADVSGKSVFSAQPPKKYADSTDWVLVIKEDIKHSI